jgi:putative component of toxin-antitoxin plasmid stabilization module
MNTINLEYGKFYKNEDGDIVQIVQMVEVVEEQVHSGSGYYMYLDQHSDCYYQCGSWFCGSNNGSNLIEEVQ